MSDIFISYEKSDLRYAEMLAHSFGVCGWTTFWDRTIPAGSAWRKTIGRELDSARCVVVLWSKASLDSDWVHEEADDARRRGILVPVLIEDIQAPIGFRTIQAGNLVNWDGTESTRAFRRLVTDIAVKIGPPPNVEVEEGKRPAAVIEPNAESKPVRRENSQYLIVVYYQGPQREREAQAVGAALAAKGFRYHVEDTDLRSTKLNKPRGWIFIQPADKGTDVIDDVAAIVRTMSAPDKVEVEGTLNRTMNGDVQVQLW